MIESNKGGQQCPPFLLQLMQRPLRDSTHAQSHSPCTTTLTIMFLPAALAL
jgi:hypothetical protein